MVVVVDATEGEPIVATAKLQIVADCCVAGYASVASTDDEEIDGDAMFNAA